jgi:arylsulfatase A-like enzyme
MMGRQRAVVVCLIAGLLCQASGCTRRGGPNILLIVADALRADRLGAYGNRRGLTPFIDSLAARGYVFRNAYAQSSWTNPSVASILTSRFQSQHGIITFESVLADAELTLPEVLKQHSYTTGFFSANGLISKRMGFAQGYDQWRSILVKATDAPRHMWVPERAAQINGDALAWLDTLSTSGGAPVFLHMHYMEPHSPYAPSPAALAHISDGGEPPNIERANSTAFFGNLLPLQPDVLQNIRNVYDAEVLSLDAELRTLFGELERRGFLNNAIVIITADHGEEFKEHGFIGHEKTLFEEVLRVPMILVLPGQTQHVDVDQIVSSIDIAPTLVDLIGGPVPPSFEGRSWKGTLVRPIASSRFSSWFGEEPLRAPTPVPAYSELIKLPERDEKRVTPHEHAVVSGSLKLIVGKEGEREYYDLKADPGEKNPNALGDAERLELQNTYQQFRTRAIEHAAPRDTQTLDEDTKERMRALGYGP